jgi:hypothetical protein
MMDPTPRHPAPWCDELDRAACQAPPGGCPCRHPEPAPASALSPAERQALTFWKFAYTARSEWGFGVADSKRLAFVKALVLMGRLSG